MEEIIVSEKELSPAVRSFKEPAIKDLLSPFFEQGLTIDEDKDVIIIATIFEDGADKLAETINELLCPFCCKLKKLDMQETKEQKYAEIFGLEPLHAELEEDLLAEKLPADLAKAYKKTTLRSRATDSSGNPISRTDYIPTNPPRRQALVDLENATYTEITPLEAWKEYRDQKDKLRIIFKKRYGNPFVVMWDKGGKLVTDTAAIKDTFERAYNYKDGKASYLSFKDIINYPDAKIYVTDEDEHRRSLPPQTSSEYNPEDSELVNKFARIRPGWGDSYATKIVNTFKTANDTIEDTGKHTSARADLDYYIRKVREKEKEAQELESKLAALSETDPEYQEKKAIYTQRLDTAKENARWYRNRYFEGRAGEEQAKQQALGINKKLAKLYMIKTVLKKEAEKFRAVDAGDVKNASSDLYYHRYAILERSLADLNKQLASLKARIADTAGQMTTELKQDYLNQVNKKLAEIAGNFGDLASEYRSMTGHDYKFENLDLKSFDQNINEYLTENYADVIDYESSDCFLKDNKIIVEGSILFDNGEEKKTSFTFTCADNTLKGLNENLGDEAEMYIVEGEIVDKTFFTKNIKYSYTMQGVLIEGITKK